MKKHKSGHGFSPARGDLAGDTAPERFAEEHDVASQQVDRFEGGGHEANFLLEPLLVRRNRDIQECRSEK